MKHPRFRFAAAVVALCCVLIPTSAASAKTTSSGVELKMYTENDFAGGGAMWDTCTVDLPDNVYDSGTQNITDYCTVWNNTVFWGDQPIAKLFKDQFVPAFDKLNAADHVTTGG